MLFLKILVLVRLLFIVLVITLVRSLGTDNRSCESDLFQVYRYFRFYQKQNSFLRERFTVPVRAVPRSPGLQNLVRCAPKNARKFLQLLVILVYH